MQTSTQFSLDEFGFWSGEDDTGLHEAVVVIVPTGHILTEGSDILASEAGDELITEP